MQITKPTFLLDKRKVLANIEKMSRKAKDANLFFRPHFKTHCSAEIGNWFRDFGVEGITVSSVDMAIYFADNGWNDITIAFPVNILQWQEIDALAEKINLNIIVENIQAIDFLEKKLTHPVGVFIKTDTGYNRTGIDAEDFDKILILLNRLKNCVNLIFIGFLTHAGNTYKSRGKDEVAKIMEEAKNRLLALKLFFKPHFPMMQLSWGDTPSCSLGNDFYGLDEMRPGNFVFFDEMQVQIGSCTSDEIACAVVCPVVATHSERNEAVIYGGAIHFSKEFITVNGMPFYGRVVRFSNNSWDCTKNIGYIRSLSQEHGIISIKDKNSELNAGDLVAVLPVHSCLTANLMKQYTILETGEIIHSFC